MRTFAEAAEIELRREEYDFRDLLNDFECVKDMNEQLAMKYEDLCSSFPYASELRILITALQTNPLQYDGNTLRNRLFQLKRFLSALEHLELKDAMYKPPKYSDVEKIDQEKK